MNEQFSPVDSVGKQNSYPSFEGSEKHVRVRCWLRSLVQRRLIMPQDPSTTTLHLLAAMVAVGLILIWLCRLPKGQRGRWKVFVVLLAAVVAGYGLGIATYPAASGYLAMPGHARPGGILGAISGGFLAIVLSGFLFRFRTLIAPQPKGDPESPKAKNSDPDRQTTVQTAPPSRIGSCVYLLLMSFAVWEFAWILSAAALSYLNSEIAVKKQDVAAVAPIHKCVSAVSSRPFNWMLVPEHARFFVEVRQVIELGNKTERTSPLYRSDEFVAATEDFPSWARADADTVDEGTLTMMPIYLNDVIQREAEDRFESSIRRTLLMRHLLPHHRSTEK
ncbi:MAG: hypothetical protein ACC628_03980 [Pirellulaceae bacterium]